MGTQPWRSSFGLAVVLLWTGIIGFPVLIFHLTSHQMTLGVHLHAAILFVASQVLVFWLAARAAGRRPRAGTPPRQASPVAGRGVAERVWEAEVFDGPPARRDAESRSEPVLLDGARAAPITIRNYLASAKGRLVMIEPGGTRYLLLPGQELQLFPGTVSDSLRYQIIESDLATQVFVDGAAAADLAVHLTSAEQPGRI